MIGRIDHGWRTRAELKSLPQAPSTYLERFTYDTISHSKPIMEFVIKTVGAERVMLGSDYCFTMGYDRPVQFLELEGKRDEAFVNLRAILDLR